MLMAINILLFSKDKYISDHFSMMFWEDPQKYSLLQFTDLDAAVDYLQKGHKTHCIWASKEDLNVLSNCAKSSCLIAMSDNTSFQPDDEGHFELNIYQEKNKILNDLDQLLSEVGLFKDRQNKKQGNTSIISFYSTQGGSGKSTLAYLCALKAAENSSTVFLDLEPQPASSAFYHQEEKSSAEAMLLSIQNREPSEKLLSFIRRNEHGIYVFPIAESMQDQGTLQKDDVDYLLRSLEDSGKYRYIFVDLGSALGDIERTVMESSTAVVLPYTDDKIGSLRRDLLQNDPNYYQYPMAGKEIAVENRCKHKNSDKAVDVRFPISNSLGSMSGVADILAANRDFYNGCGQILELAEKR